MRKRPVRLVAWLGALALLGYVALAGGTDNNSDPSAQLAARGRPTGPPVAEDEVDCASGTISGAGATFPQAIVQQWIKDYGAACPGATVAYQSVGSGAGIQQLAGGTVDFGASDAVMKPDEQASVERANGAVLHVPWTAGGIALIYQLPGVDELRLRPETVAGIFSGAITKWNAPELVADNRGAGLPDRPIQVVHRSDGSGTTMVFTAYLSAVAPTVWTAGAAKDVRWPVGQGAKGSDGVTSVVKQTEGAISYAEVSFAEANGLGVAKVRNPAGRFVAPTPDAVTAAIEDAKVPENLQVEANYSPAKGAAYPISTTTWALVPRRPSDAGRAKLLQSFLLYALGPGQRSAPGLSYAPLPQPVAIRALAAVYGMEVGA